MKQSKKSTVDYGVTFATLVLVVAVILVLLCFPETSSRYISIIHNHIISNWSWAFFLCCISSFGILLWVTFSKYGNVHLGDKEDKPKYSTFAWAGMLFTSNVGSSIVILGFMEPIYYVESPPFGIEPFSDLAYEYAHMYGQFHWGPSAWAFYVPAITALAIVIFKKKEVGLKLSMVFNHMNINPKVCKVLGKSTDILVMFGMLASISTSLGIAVPIVSNLVAGFLGVPDNDILKIIVILIWVSIFTFSVFRGLDNGIKMLSNFNIVLLGSFFVIILLIGPTFEIISMEINSIGLMADNFIRLNTWLDPFGNGDFLELWTVFYWGWWLAFMPMMALFIVRISKGRSLKQVIWGQLVWGSVGCALCFSIFGGYSLYLQKEGIVDISSILLEHGQATAVNAILSQVPFSFIIKLLFCILLFIFLATTIDSTAYVLSSNSSKNLSIDDQPPRTQRIFWALLLACLAVSLTLLDEIKAVQTISLVAGVPFVFIHIYLCYASIKLLKENYHADKDNLQ